MPLTPRAGDMVRVWLGGEEITHMVTDVSVTYEHEWIGMSARPQRTIEMTLRPTEDEFLPSQEGRYRPPPVPEPTPTHRFVQDPNEQATLCGVEDCGMWPDHHNHTGRARWSGGPCVCQECETNPDYLG